MLSFLNDTHNCTQAYNHAHQHAFIGHLPLTLRLYVSHVGVGFLIYQRICLPYLVGHLPLCLSSCTHVGLEFLVCQKICLPSNFRCHSLAVDYNASTHQYILKLIAVCIDTRSFNSSIQPWLSYTQISQEGHESSSQMTTHRDIRISLSCQP